MWSSWTSLMRLNISAFLSQRVCAGFLWVPVPSHSPKSTTSGLIGKSYPLALMCLVEGLNNNLKGFCNVALSFPSGNCTVLNTAPSWVSFKSKLTFSLTKTPCSQSINEAVQAVHFWWSICTNIHNKQQNLPPCFGRLRVIDCVDASEFCLRLHRAKQSAFHSQSPVNPLQMCPYSQSKVQAAVMKGASARSAHAGHLKGFSVYSATCSVSSAKLCTDTAGWMADTCFHRQPLI